MSRKSTVAKGSWIEARVGGFDGASNASTPATAASTNTTIAAAPQRILPIAASIQNFAQVSDVLGESAAAGARLRAACRQTIFRFATQPALSSVSRCAPRLPSVAATKFLNSSALFGASTFSAAMILGRIYPLR